MAGRLWGGYGHAGQGGTQRVLMQIVTDTLMAHAPPLRGQQQQQDEDWELPDDTWRCPLHLATGHEVVYVDPEPEDSQPEPEPAAARGGSATARNRRRRRNRRGRVQAAAAAAAGSPRDQAAERYCWWTQPDMFCKIMAFLPHEILSTIASCCTQWACGIDICLGMHCEAWESLEARTETALQCLDDFEMELQDLLAVVEQEQPTLASLKLIAHISRCTAGCVETNVAVREVVASNHGRDGIARQVVQVARARCAVLGGIASHAAREAKQVSARAKQAAADSVAKLGPCAHMVRQFLDDMDRARGRAGDDDSTADSWDVPMNGQPPPAGGAAAAAPGLEALDGPEARRALLTASAPPPRGPSPPEALGLLGFAAAFGARGFIGAPPAASALVRAFLGAGEEPHAGSGPWSSPASPAGGGRHAPRPALPAAFHAVGLAAALGF
eukprot:TRINITY_DN25241_c0_g1_i1.p1 TRINITY_DN25241_c0_g1~~TRINITY_DN25241_c0_g1_i1.p1  ORF type:complete len:442 (+),score=77.62 TRINITY_DN25241_c0_g1_i1:85-1410(+)